MVIQPYRDITDKLGHPIWYDEVGCPRYEKFKPRMINFVYARQVALLIISCQSCHKLFTVAVSQDHPRDHKNERNFIGLAKLIKSNNLWYGDPPMHGDCSGYTMSSNTVRVAEFWVCEMTRWRRDHSYEIEIDGDEL